MRFPKVILGTFQNNNYKDLLEVVRTCVDCGITCFDTAPSYGTESILGNVLKQVRLERNLAREDLFISDKIDAWQMQESNGNVRKHVESALEKLQTNYIDLYLIHWPIAEYVEPTWRCLMELQAEGILKSIGICNVRKRHLESWRNIGVQPKYIQIERHPLRTCNDEMLYCKDKNIKVIAYSPLCRMHPDIRCCKELKDIADKYNKNIGQIVLRWHIDTNSTPVFMTTKANRIMENVDIFDFSLTEDEIQTINNLNQNYKIFLESWGCPGF